MDSMESTAQTSKMESSTGIDKAEADQEQQQATAPVATRRHQPSGASFDPPHAPIHESSGPRDRDIEVVVNARQTQHPLPAPDLCPSPDDEECPGEPEENSLSRLPGLEWSSPRG